MSLKNIKIIVLTMFLGVAVQAQKSLVAKSASVTFKIKNGGFNVDGSFQNLEATILFDENNLQKSSIDASVLAKTIDTGIDRRNNHLRKDKYFEVEKYPKIRMKSTKIEKSQTGFKGYFTLTIKGTSKEIVLPFTFDSSVFKGSFKINRLDFKVGNSNWLMGDEVEIFIMVKV